MINWTVPPALVYGMDLNNFWTFEKFFTHVSYLPAQQPKFVFVQHDSTHQHAFILDVLFYHFSINF